MKYPRMAFAVIASLVICLGATRYSYASSLRDELSGLVAEHPQVKAGRNTLESSRMEIRKSMAGYLPTVSLNASGGPEHIDNPTTRAAGKQWSRTKNIAGLTVTQNLFDGFSTSSTVQTARLNTELAKYTLEATVQNTVFEGITTYITVLKQVRLIELARNNENTIRKQLNLEDERVRRGSGVNVDVLQAKSRLQISKERRITLEGGLENAVSSYVQVFNHLPELNKMTDPVPPVELIPSELEKVIKIAVAENPSIYNSSISVEVARENKNKVLSEYSPVVDMVGSWNYEKHNSGVLGTRRDYSVVVESTWDLFTGFSSNASRTQAAFDYGSTRQNLEFATRKIIEQTRLAWQAIVTSKSRLELLGNAVNIASEVAVARKKLREAGKETVINVLDAENEVSNARINFISASYDELIAIYQLLQVMGRLDTAHLNLQ